MAKSTRITGAHYLLIWFFLRALTSLLAAVFSTLRPLTPIEKTIPVWPPVNDLTAWLNRVLVAPWLRWDAVWFTRIVSRGYAAGDGTTNFQPLFPWLSVPLARLGADPTLSLLATGTLAALGFFWVFYHLAGLDLEPAEARTWALLFAATTPVAFILFAPYTESLFLLWATLSLYAARRGRWGLAAAGAFLAALTRQQGLFLALPLAWGAWQASGRSLRGVGKAGAAWLSVLAAPAGLVAWGVYRFAYLHEGGLDFHNLQNLVYSTLISPSAHQVVPVQAFLWPWQALWIAVSKAVRAPDQDIIVNLLLGFGFLLALAAAWPHMHNGDRLYSLAVTVAGFSYYTGPVHPYMGLPRHLLLAVPVFVGLAAVVRKPWQRISLVVAQILGLILLVLMYVLESWVP